MLFGRKKRKKGGGESREEIGRNSVLPSSTKFSAFLTTINGWNKVHSSSQRGTARFAANGRLLPDPLKLVLSTTATTKNDNLGQWKETHNLTLIVMTI